MKIKVIRTKAPISLIDLSRVPEVKKYIKESKRCSHPDCEKNVFAGGYCSKHYQRFHKHGNTNTVLRKGRKSHGGHEEYQNHALLKKNRLKKLAMTPICEYCNKNAATMTHHKDLTKTNHDIDNLMSLCGNRCHSHLHREIRNKAKLQEIEDVLIFKEDQKFVESVENIDKFRKSAYNIIDNLCKR